MSTHPTFATHTAPPPFLPLALVPETREPNDKMARLVARAQSGDGGALELLLEQFRPLLRSRMHRVWGAMQEQMAGVEWGDVESQVQLFFLTRLHGFDAGRGVFFPFYIERLLDLDCLAWVRTQKRQRATPFSQLASPSGLADDETDLDWWLSRGGEDVPCQSKSVERMLGLRVALQKLTPAQQQVIWACCVQGQTETQVAEKLGVSRSAVRNRLAGALERLRTYFREEDEAGGVPRDEVVEALTRTGRASSRPTKTDEPPPMRGLRREFWDWWMQKMAMAKDERRPDLVGVGAGRPVLLQGTFDFPRTGLRSPQLLSPKLTYEVPPGHVLGVRYVRVGIACPKMACLSTVVNGLPHRLVPVAADSTEHVAIAIVDPLVAGSQLEIHIASEAPGIAILDVGCLLMPA